jgi:hypothetical protein
MPGQWLSSLDPSTYADVKLVMTFSVLTHTALTAATPHNIDGGRNQQSQWVRFRADAVCAVMPGELRGHTRL